MVGGYLLYSRESFKVNKKEALILAILGICYALSSEFLFLGYDFLTLGRLNGFMPTTTPLNT